METPASPCRCPPPAPLESSFKEWKLERLVERDAGAHTLESSFKEWKPLKRAKCTDTEDTLESSFKEWKRAGVGSGRGRGAALESSFKEWKRGAVDPLALPMEALLNLPLRNGNACPICMCVAGILS